MIKMICVSCYHVMWMLTRGKLITYFMTSVLGFGLRSVGHARYVELDSFKELIDKI